MLRRIRAHRYELERVAEHTNHVISKDIPKKNRSLTRKIVKTLLISSLLRMGWYSRNTILTGVSSLTDSVKPSAIAAYDNQSNKDTNKNADKILIQEYIIKKGDTLSDLAREYNTSVKEILYYNPQIRDKDLININEDLILPIKQI